MSKQKKSEAAILGLLDRFSIDDIDVSEQDEPIYRSEYNTQANSTIKKSTVKNDKLATEKKAPNSLGQIIEIPTSKCRPWKFADRNEFEMGNIEELSNSIKSNGQQEPILVRPIPQNEEGLDYEVIFGHRRWLACKLCNKKVIAIAKVISDKDAAVAQKEENQNREDLSPYAKSKSYQKLLKNGVFKSQSELSAHMGISRQTIAALMSFTKINVKVMEALLQPSNLPLRTAIKLAQLCEAIKSDEELEILISLIPDIESGSLPYKKLDLKMLSTSECYSPTSQEENKITPRVIKNDFNVKLFTAGLNQNKVPSITFHKWLLIIIFMKKL